MNPDGPGGSAAGGQAPNGELAAPDASIELSLLGGFAIRVDSVLQPDPGLWSIRSLGALLALADAPRISRAKAAEELWPDSLASQAATNLRKALFELGRRWPAVAARIESDASSLGWRRGVEVTVDVHHFEELAARAVGQSELRRALAIYTGEFMPGCEQRWAVRARARLAALHDRLCRALALIWEQERRYAEALELVLKVATRQPAEEDSWVRALRLALAAGGEATLNQVWDQTEDCFAQAFGEGPPEQLSREYLRLRQAAAHAPALAQVAFVGREREWASLRAAWELTRRGQFGLVWIQGESGIGKSALAREFARWIATQSVHARIGHASGVSAPPLEAVIDALRNGPPLPDPGPPWDAELKALLDPRSALRSRTQAPVAPEEARIRRLMAAVEAMTADAPCLWVLDDLQDADPDNWDWIRLAARHLSRLPALVVVISRNDKRTVARRRDLFEAVGSAVACHLVAVGPLADREASSLVRQVADPTPQIERELLAIAQGNPLHLLEAARLWVAEKGVAGGPTLGPTMQATLGRRLSLLPSVQRRLAEVLAVLGRPARPELLMRCARRAGQSNLEALLQTRIVRVDGEGAIFFHHSALAEAVLRQIPPARRRRLAGTLALALGESGGDLRDRCRLWEEAGQVARAKEAFLQLAVEAERSCHLEDAAFAYGRLIALSPPPERVEPTLRQADILYQAGAITDAEGAYRQAIQLAVEAAMPGAIAHGRLGLARILSLGGDVETAQTLAEDSDQTLARLGDDRERAVALLCQGELVGLRQEFAHAEALLAQARELAERSADLRVAVQALNRLGDLRYERGDYEAAHDSYQEARLKAEQVGDTTGMLEAMGSLGVVLEETGKLVAGATYQREVVDLTYSQRLSRHLCYGLNNLAACYQDIARWQDAEDLIRASCRLALDINDMRAISITTGMLGLCRSGEGDIGLAERLFDLAISLARAFPIPGYLALQICHLTDGLLDAGRLERVETLIGEAWRVRASGTPHTAVRLELNRVRWLHASGQIDTESAKRRMMGSTKPSRAIEAEALTSFRVWELTRTEADRQRALDLVASVFARHPHEWWQRCQFALSGVRPELPELPALPVWLDSFAPAMTDLLPWLDAYAARHGSDRLKGPVKDARPSTRSEDGTGTN